MHHDGGRLRDQALPHGNVGARDALHAARVAQPLPGALHHHLHMYTRTWVQSPDADAVLQSASVQRTGSAPLSYLRPCPRPLYSRGLPSLYRASPRQQRDSTFSCNCSPLNLHPRTLRLISFLAFFFAAAAAAAGPSGAAFDGEGRRPTAFAAATSGS